MTIAELKGQILQAIFSRIDLEYENLSAFQNDGIDSKKETQRQVSRAYNFHANLELLRHEKSNNI
jgi:hypothetical protein